MLSITQVPVADLEPYLDQITDKTLKYGLEHGVGVLHETMPAAEREIVNRLFTSGAIQVPPPPTPPPTPTPTPFHPPSPPPLHHIAKYAQNFPLLLNDLSGLPSLSLQPFSKRPCWDVMG